MKASQEHAAPTIIVQQLSVWLFHESSVCFSAAACVLAATQVSCQLSVSADLSRKYESV